MKYTDEYRAYQEELKQQIVDICRAAVRGEIGVIDASRKLRNLQYQLFESIDHDFLCFIAIESETDHLPVGNERQYWNKEVLIEKDKEIAAYESDVKQKFLDACNQVIERFSPSRGF